MAGALRRAWVTVAVWVAAHLLDPLVAFWEEACKSVVRGVFATCQWWLNALSAALLKTVVRAPPPRPEAGRGEAWASWFGGARGTFNAIFERHVGGQGGASGAGLSGTATPSVSPSASPRTPQRAGPGRASRRGGRPRISLPSPASLFGFSSEVVLRDLTDRRGLVEDARVNAEVALTDGGAWLRGALRRALFLPPDDDGEGGGRCAGYRRGGGGWDDGGGRGRHQGARDDSPPSVSRTAFADDPAASFALDPLPPLPRASRTLRAVARGGRSPRAGAPRRGGGAAGTGAIPPGSGAAGLGSGLGGLSRPPGAWAGAGAKKPARPAGGRGLLSFLPAALSPVRGGWESAHVWTASDLILQAGYPLQEHSVTTEDGYVLLLHRIPRVGARDVVFFQHGVLDTSLGWVANGSVGSQAFAASDGGFDVWLGNSRANPPRLNARPERRGLRYWSYSANELALKDIAASVEHIHRVKCAELGRKDDVDTWVGRERAGAASASPDRRAPAEEGGGGGDGGGARHGESRGTPPAGPAAAPAPPAGGEAGEAPASGAREGGASPGRSVSRAPSDASAFAAAAGDGEARATPLLQEGPQPSRVTRSWSDGDLLAGPESTSEVLRPRGGLAPYGSAPSWARASVKVGGHAEGYNGASSDDGLPMGWGDPGGDSLKASAARTAGAGDSATIRACGAGGGAGGGVELGRRGASTPASPSVRRGARVADAPALRRPSSTPAPSEPYRLQAVGHSLGAASLLVYATARRMEGRPHHLRRLVLMSPAGFHGAVPLAMWPMRFLMPLLQRAVQLLAPGRGLGLRLPSPLLRYVAFKLTLDLRDVPALRDLVRAGARLAMAGDSSDWDQAMLMPHYNAVSMPAVSLATAAHFAQWANDGSFRLFDYGSEKENRKRYAGLPRPPSISENYSSLDIPVDLVTGSLDRIVTPADVGAHFAALEAGGVRVTLREFSCSHMDLTFAVRPELRDYILSRLQRPC